MICYGNLFYNLPLLGFHSNYEYTINCCTFLFNMSYSRIVIKKYYTGIVKMGKSAGLDSLAAEHFVYSHSSATIHLSLLLPVC